jgi:DNA-binding transcriptional ArsR family regulator
MVRFVFGPEDVARVRFAFSPNWELVASVRVLARPSAHALHLPWLQEARQALRDFDGMPMLLALIPPEGYVPDFLGPPPETPLPNFEDELAAIRGVPADRVRTEIGMLHGRRPPAVLRPLLEHPRKGLRTLTDALVGYWERTLDRHWSRLRSLLQGEVLHRARQFTVGGSELLFHDLHEDVRWDGERLCVGIRYDAEIALEGRGLLMLPSAFYWPRVAVVTDPAWQPSLTYPPRGVATLWDPDEPRGPEGLEALFGATRAAILAELDTPRSTTELARRLDLTPSAVSQHLGRLSRGGVVNGSREGREVLYVLTGAGEALLSGAGPPRA